jgi:hypothetical protein
MTSNLIEPSILAAVPFPSSSVDRNKKPVRV